MCWSMFPLWDSGCLSHSQMAVPTNIATRASDKLQTQKVPAAWRYALMLLQTNLGLADLQDY